MQTNLNGKRIVAFGFGRSGLAVGLASLKLGAKVKVLDETPSDRLVKYDLLSTAKKQGLEVITGWKGSLSDETPDWVVVNPAVRVDHPALVEARQAGIEVIGEIEFAYRIARAPIVAITGTNGKSTTTVMAYLCLTSCGVDAVLCGNVFGTGYPEVSLTEAAVEATEDQILVAEVSSFQLETIKDFRPVAAGITNVWADHLDRHGSIKAYSAAKHRIFENQRQGDFAIVRANDPAVIAPGQVGTGYRLRGRRTSGEAATSDLPTVLTFGATGEHARVEERELIVLDKRIPLESLSFDEPHNYQNACMAALLAYGALIVQAERQQEGSAAQVIEESRNRYREDHPRKPLRPGESYTVPRVLPICVESGLREFRGLEHRMERVGEKDGVRVINNSMCTNPDAVVKSVQAVRDRTHILMGGVNKDLDFGPLRHYLANHRHTVYLFGRDGGELDAQLGGGHRIFSGMSEAFQAAANAALPGEVVMLAPGCASTDSFRDFRDRGNVFKAIAKDWLRS